MAGGTTGRQSTGIAYSPPVDGLRALAVLSVLYNHMVTPLPGFSNLGVRLFFCISGYLITHILLSARERGGSAPAILKAFYARRILRIWPAYYAALLAALVVGAQGVRETALWHLVFATNFQLASFGVWEPEAVGHLWTLAVEEQFYLFWPLLILLLPRRAVPWAIAALPLLCVAWMASLTPAEILQEPGPMILLPAQFDVLGAGALLAYVERHGRVAAWWVVPVCVMGLALSPLTIGLDWPWPLIGILNDAIGVAVVQPMSGTSYVAVLLFARHAPWGLPERLLGNRLLVWLGQRSYGIYLYHIYLLLACIWLTGRGRGWLVLIVVGGASIVLAALSWRFLERPALRFKARFPYPAGSSTLKLHGHPGPEALGQPR